jgi:hypothetical protein
MFGWLATPDSRVNIALVGPIELVWKERATTKNQRSDPLFWLWSLSRVFLFEISRAQNLANAYGFRLAFDPFDLKDRSLIFQVWEYVIAFRWVPAHVQANRLTMREAARAKRMQAQAEQLGAMLKDLFGQLGINAEPGTSGPMPDLRGKSNLN